MGDFESYDAARSRFKWYVPEYYNIGVDACDRWAAIDPGRLAILEHESGTIYETSFEALRRRSNQIANLLTAHGLRAGDRVGVLASQRADTAAAHIAIYECAAVAVPLFSLFGADALHHRLADSAARSSSPIRPG